MKRSAFEKLQKDVAKTEKRITSLFEKCISQFTFKPLSWNNYLDELEAFTKN